MPASNQSAILLLQCPDRHGIVSGVAGLLASFDCNIVQSAQFADEEAAQFFMRVVFSLPASSDRSDIEDAITPLAKRFHMTWRIYDPEAPVRTAILVSKPDHCLLDLLHRVDRRELNLSVAAVISNHTSPKRIADNYGAHFEHLPITPETKPQQEARLIDLLKKNDVELIVLARYMQVLSEDLCKQLSGNAINIHHSFLPSFKGAKPYHQAHKKGVKLIGATAHFVTPDLDEGPIIEQKAERVDHTMSPDDLVRIGRDVERRSLAEAVRLYAERRVLLNGTKTVILR